VSPSADVRWLDVAAVDVVLSTRARRDLERLDPQTNQRVREALRRLGDEGYGDVVKLAGERDRYRLRIGDWRAEYQYGDPRAIRVIRVRHRREAYRD
jgi:mRNA-degrading endonuclease RelE of RelBE toxin-antitoxin system